MSSDATSDQHAGNGYLQRAELLADLGRYDDAATEIGYAIALEPGNSRALTMLARVHLAAERPDAALAAAESAVAAAPAQIDPLVVHGLALADLRRFSEAAQIADKVLALGSDDAYAQRSGAAILAEARNGQRALHAAWRGVELAPEEPQAHLVLGLVSTRLELFDLAERAYREALRLDPELVGAPHDVGIVQLERKRYAVALERLAKAAAWRPGQREVGGRADVALVRLVRTGAGYSLVAVVILAFLAAGDGPLSRVWAAFMALAGFLLMWVYAAKLPTPARALPDLLRLDRALALAVYAVAAVPCLVLLYALVGTPWPLVLAVAATAVARIAVLGPARPLSG